MRAELQRYLDGELPFDELPLELREEARGWDRALDDGSAGRESGTLAPAWIEDAVMDEVTDGVSAEGRPAPFGGWARWLTRPRTIRVSPLVGGLAAAALAALLLLPGRGAPPGGSETPATIYVQFLMEAPTARSVAVAGDFNAWQASHPLTDADGDGVWTGRIAVQPGIHEYMFVIDGDEWVTPPGAEGYRDDGFGSRNAVVTVLPAA